MERCRDKLSAPYRDVEHIEISATFNNYKNNCIASSQGLEATKLQTLSRK